MSEPTEPDTQPDLQPDTATSEVERGELVAPETGAEADEDRREAIDEPAKVMRIGSMMKQLLDEVRNTDLDEASRDRLRDIYDLSVDELGAALSPDLRAELDRLAMPFGDDEVPSGAELRIAKAQLVGWLEGLFHGIQATLFAQQMAARHQIEQMRQNELMPPSGAEGPSLERPGTYL